MYVTVKDYPSWWQKLWEELRGEPNPGQRGVQHQREDLVLAEAGCGGRTVAHSGGHSRLVVRLQRSGHVRAGEEGDCEQRLAVLTRPTCVSNHGQGELGLLGEASQSRGGACDPAGGGGVESLHCGPHL